MSIWRLLPVLLLLVACKNTNPQGESVSEELTPVEQELKMMTSTVDFLRVRKEPLKDSEVVSSLREGEEVLWTGQVGPSNDTITLRGKTVIAPWYQIETGAGRTGWVFSGALTAWTFGEDLPYLTCLQAYNQGDFSQFYPCLDGISQQASGPEQVKNDQSGLRLRLRDGKSVQLENDLDVGRNYKAYQYIGEVSEVYVIKKNTRGGSSFVLVHQMSGDQVEVDGLPQPVPMSNSLFCIGARLDQPGSYALTIVASEPRFLRAVFTQTFPEQYLVGVQWPLTGLPTVTLRDNRGDLSTWKLIRGVNNQWDLEKKA